MIIMEFHFNWQRWFTSVYTFQHVEAASATWSCGIARVAIFTVLDEHHTSAKLQNEFPKRVLQISQKVEN